MKKFLPIMTLLLMVSLVLVGCEDEQKKREIKEAKYHLYYISADETELIQDIYNPADENPEAMVKDLMQFLKSEEAKEGNLPLLPPEVAVNTHSITEGTLTIDFNQAYEEMSDTREVLTRAGIVKLFAQIADIDYVKFSVEGQELVDSHDIPLSIMNGDTFVEYTGEDINSYQYATIKLYFTNADGTCLIPEERTVYYNSNVPLERVVVEQLIKGPTTEGLYATLPSNLNIMGVTTDGSDCYVNVDSAFVSDVLPLQDSSIPVYSIVNSLAEGCRMEKVQISVNGETNVSLRESVKLNQFFEKNNQLIQEQKETKE